MQSWGCSLGCSGNCGLHPKRGIILRRGEGGKAGQGKEGRGEGRAVERTYHLVKARDVAAQTGGHRRCAGKALSMKKKNGEKSHVRSPARTPQVALTSSVSTTEVPADDMASKPCTIESQPLPDDGAAGIRAVGRLGDVVACG